MSFLLKIDTGKLLDLVGMMKIHVLSNFYASRTETRPAARPNEARKKLFLKHLENTFLCIPDHLRPTLFFASYKMYFFKIYQVQKSGYYSSIWDTDVILCNFFRKK